MDPMGSQRLPPTVHLGVWRSDSERWVFVREPSASLGPRCKSMPGLYNDALLPPARDRPPHLGDRRRATILSIKCPAGGRHGPNRPQGPGRLSEARFSHPLMVQIRELDPPTALGPRGGRRSPMRVSEG